MWNNNVFFDMDCTHGNRNTLFVSTLPHIRYLLETKDKTKRGEKLHREILKTGAPQGILCTKYMYMGRSTVQGQSKEQKMSPQGCIFEKVCFIECDYQVFHNKFIPWRRAEYTVRNFETKPALFRPNHLFSKPTLTLKRFTRGCTRKFTICL